jgi:hypothetical protein
VSVIRLIERQLRCLAFGAHSGGMSLKGQVEVKTGAVSFFTCHTDFAPVQFEDFLGDRKSQARGATILV